MVPGSTHGRFTHRTEQTGTPLTSGRGALPTVTICSIPAAVSAASSSAADRTPRKTCQAVSHWGGVPNPILNRLCDGVCDGCHTGAVSLTQP